MIARSRAFDLWREGQAAGRASDRLKLVVEPRRARVEDRPAAATERADTRETVRAALRRLPEPQREALVLAYWGGLSAGEIAEREQVPLGTAKSRIRLGLARLRRNALHWRTKRPRAGSLQSNVRSTAEPAGHDARRVGDRYEPRPECRRPSPTGAWSDDRQPKEDLALRPSSIGVPAVRRRALFRLSLRGGMPSRRVLR